MLSVTLFIKVLSAELNKASDKYSEAYEIYVVCFEMILKNAVLLRIRDFELVTYKIRIMYIETC